MKKIGTLKIEVFDFPDDRTHHKVRVFIGKIENDKEFQVFMMAAEFLLHLTAQKSNAGYEKALELLCQGAMTYQVTERPDLRKR